MQLDNLPKRILYLTDTLSNGGAERQLALLTKSLPSDWDRRVIGLADGPYRQVIQNAGVCIEVRARKFRFDPTPAFGVWRVIRMWQPQIIHAWGWMSLMSVGLVGRMFHIPVIDSSIRMGMRPLRRSVVQQIAMRWATRIIANSYAGLMAWHMTPPRGCVIYNGFDPARLNLCQHAPMAHFQPFTIVMTGRMSREKDFGMLLDAARTGYDSARSDWRFVLIGEGPDRARHIQAAQKLIDVGVVHFPTPRLEVIEFLSQANVGVLLSHPTLHAEGISNSIMEYMACGLPVVCNDSGGNRELVLDGETGFIILPRDVNALVKKLTWLKEHPDQAAQMGQAGRERILTHFSVEQMVEKTIAVYREVL